MEILLLNACQSRSPLVHELVSLLKNSVSDSTRFLQIDLSEKTILPCGGCMYCQIKQPGKCIKHDDMEYLTPIFIKAHAAIFVTEVFCGGYSSIVKKFVDRLCPVLTACFEKRYGETRHIARYNRRPVMLGIGVNDASMNTENVFSDLFTRNMKQLNIPRYASFILHKNESVFNCKDVLLSCLRTLEVG